MTSAFIHERWDEIVPVLEEYIRIPNNSPVADVLDAHARR